MNSVDKAFATQLDNIQMKTGKTLDELYGLIGATRLFKHGEIRSWLTRELKLGYGDANTVASFYLKTNVAATATAESSANVDPLDAIYVGAKAALRPIHDQLMIAITKFGPFETSPKKANVSLRCKKQFSTIGPATNSRVDVGLNVRDLNPSSRLIEMPAGSMCQYVVRVTDIAEIDEELIAWIKQAYDSSK